MQTARERVVRTDPGSGKQQTLQEWQYRQAPSVGARALAILHSSMYSDSFMQLAEAALRLYLSEEQMAERKGFYRSRKSNAPQKVQGVQFFG